jgi:hypothetical protein
MLPGAGAYEMEVFGEDDLVQVMTAALQTRSVGATQVCVCVVCACLCVFLRAYVYVRACIFLFACMRGVCVCLRVCVCDMQDQHLALNDRPSKEFWKLDQSTFKTYCIADE